MPRARIPAASWLFSLHANNAVAAGRTKEYLAGCAIWFPTVSMPTMLPSARRRHRKGTAQHERPSLRRGGAGRAIQCLCLRVTEGGVWQCQANESKGADEQSGYLFKATPGLINRHEFFAHRQAALVKASECCGCSFQRAVDGPWQRVDRFRVRPPNPLRGEGEVAEQYPHRGIRTADAGPRAGIQITNLRGALQKFLEPGVQIIETTVHFQRIDLGHLRTQSRQVEHRRIVSEGRFFITKPMIAVEATHGFLRD